MPTFRFPTNNFRAVPSPIGKSRFGLFFTPARFVSPDLWDWREVNPREVNPRSGVYAKILDTLENAPEQFHERNRGITILASKMEYDDKRHEVVIELETTSEHGVADGAHTLHAIINRPVQEDDTNPSHVFIKLMVGIETSQIPEIAGGLNTSEKVDLKSLENLRDHFEHLKSAISGEPFAPLVAYKMNDSAPIDVREILYYLAVFDCTEYSDKSHPVALFGRKEGIVRKFADQAKDAKHGRSFRILISRVTEILKLRDSIEKAALSIPKVGQFKESKKTRIRSKTNKKNPLHFLNETVDGKIPLGWMMPMLGAFRANVDWREESESFEWIVPISELLPLCIEQLMLAIMEIHNSENSRPEYVGRNAIAWRMSYNTVASAIKDLRLAQSR